MISSAGSGTPPALLRTQISCCELSVTVSVPFESCCSRWDGSRTQSELHSKRERVGAGGKKGVSAECGRKWRSREGAGKLRAVLVSEEGKGEADGRVVDR